jgi:hypothetical protein
MRLNLRQLWFFRKYLVERRARLRNELFAIHQKHIQTKRVLELDCVSSLLLLKINWPINKDQAIISEKDAAHPLLNNVIPMEI